MEFVHIKMLPDSENFDEYCDRFKSHFKLARGMIMKDGPSVAWLFVNSLPDYLRQRSDQHFANSLDKYNELKNLKEVMKLALDIESKVVTEHIEEVHTATISEYMYTPQSLEQTGYKCSLKDSEWQASIFKIDSSSSDASAEESQSLMIPGVFLLSESDTTAGNRNNNEVQQQQRDAISISTASVQQHQMQSQREVNGTGSLIRNGDNNSRAKRKEAPSNSEEHDSKHIRKTCSNHPYSTGHSTNECRVEKRHRQQQRRQIKEERHY